ncbi:hypothetical protein CSB45_12105 [candidate division KSB3 bacterium]|uniref:Uncharacterized protein n=1 Tax=candidate division KSB3 bacterium TaxID=2044937 RepID=A0A2G6E2T8_9BACT|nr:MAG: hypothetical protein CSB45_12105 [candidate division KSB3 bacterium]PIE28840.1 MAG: hypothetical protein CSA57_11780 [candidate division KSB3 bacterium]
MGMSLKTCFGAAGLFASILILAAGEEAVYANLDISLQYHDEGEVTSAGKKKELELCFCFRRSA